MDDTTELLNRINGFGVAYKRTNFKQPLFRLTPYEYKLFLRYLSKNIPGFTNKTMGVLPTCFGVDFEVVRKPLLFDGKHIRGDSGIELLEELENEQ